MLLKFPLVIKMHPSYNESEIKSWLELCLRKENLNEVNIELVGQTEKGDGYMGDIFFLHVIGKTKNSSIKKYNLAVKCSKDNEYLREFSPMKIFFNNEIYFYETVFPSFVQFQRDKGVEDFFKSVPKCYGTISGDRDVLVFENLVKNGFSLWDRKEPMTRKHIELVIQEYAKFHSISAALQDQKPENYNKLIEHFEIFKNFGRDRNPMIDSFENAIEEMYNLLQDDLNENVLEKWKSLKMQVRPFFETIMYEDYNGLKVINHGDSWNNNFLFSYNDEGAPIKLSIIDWQISKLASPVLDLSHFLFACTSENDLDDLQTILECYHSHFTKFLTRFGSSEELYTKDQFFEDWKKMSKFGIILSSMVMKVSLAEKEEAPDIAAAGENGDFRVFEFEVRNKTVLKKRMKAIVSYVVEKKLI